MTEFTTSVGRIVWGHPAKPRPKKYQDGAQKGQTVMKDGQPVNQWAFGVAFPKQEFLDHIWPHLAATAQVGYPNGVPQRFAWKYQDGDGVDSEGKSFADREGYRGCFVLTISTELQAPGIFKWNGTKYDQLDGAAIKTGDYVAVGINAVLNIPQAGSTNTPSLYINPTAIEFIGYGAEIQSSGSADPNAVFGGQQRALPPGASATPIGGGAGVGMPGTSGMPAMPGAPAGMPPVAPAAPAMAPPPPAMAPPPPPVPAAPPPPPAMARPTDPSWIAPNPAGGELWYNGAAWVPAPALPPPATDFVHNAGMPPAPMAMPGTMPPR